MFPIILFTSWAWRFVARARCDGIRWECNRFRCKLNLAGLTVVEQDRAFAWPRIGAASISLSLSLSDITITDGNVLLGAEGNKAEVPEADVCTRGSALLGARVRGMFFPRGG